MIKLRYFLLFIPFLISCSPTQDQQSWQTSQPLVRQPVPTTTTSTTIPTTTTTTTFVVVITLVPLNSSVSTLPIVVIPVPTNPQSIVPTPQNVYYKNCDAVRAAGKAPLYRGQPGYRGALDRDHDGVACETSTTVVPTTSSGTQSTTTIPPPPTT